MTVSSRNTSSRSALSLVLYILSALALLMAVLALLWLLSAPRTVDNLAMFFQLAGIEQLAPVFLRPLRAALTYAGIVVSVLVSLIAALLFAAGRLTARQASLTERVRALEAKLQEG